MSKKSLKTEAYQIIKQKILDCEFLPGTLLNENYLCELLEISRTPIRDAVSRLEYERLVRIVRPKGILIENITLLDFNSYFESLLFLEPYAISTYGEKLKKHELQIFFNFFQTWDLTVDSETFSHITSSLHSILVEETGNPYFIQVHEQLRYQEQRIQKLFPLSNTEKGKICILYTEFLALCLEAEWENASNSMTAIIKSYKDWIFPRFINTYSSRSKEVTE